MPPIESTERAISSADRVVGALEHHVLDEVRDAVLLGPLLRDPVPTQTPTETDRTWGITSVITETPLSEAFLLNITGFGLAKAGTLLAYHKRRELEVDQQLLYFQ